MSKCPRLMLREKVEREIKISIKLLQSIVYGEIGYCGFEIKNELRYIIDHLSELIDEKGNGGKRIKISLNTNANAKN